MSVEFEPVSVGGGRRRFDPFMIGVAIVVVALAAAVVKPWETGPPTVAPGPSAAGLAETTTSPPDATASPRVPDRAIRGAPSPTWADVASVVRPHDGWGVRAIVAERTTGDRGSAAGRLFAERWSAVELDADGAGGADLERGDSWVVALGVTAPPDEIPLDTRIWRIHLGDRLEWVDARPLGPPASAGAAMLVRVDVPGTSNPSWRAGHYRIDVLGEAGIRRVVVRIPDRLGGFPGPGEWQATERGLVDATASDPSGVRSGLFATVDGVGVPLATFPGRPLDEVGAWAAVEQEVGTGSTPTIARAYLPRATGLGVMLTEHAFVHLAVLQRLAPTPILPARPARGGISSAHGRTPFVVFDAPDGEAMDAGVYAISVSWTDPAGLHAVTWHVELRPGPIQPGT